MAPELSVKGRDTAMGCSLRNSSSLVMENRGEKEIETFYSMRSKHVTGLFWEFGGNPNCPEYAHKCFAKRTTRNTLRYSDSATISGIGSCSSQGMHFLAFCFVGL